VTTDLHATDCGALYERKRGELLAWLATQPADALATPVPATPA
jgi:hypothetical protein